MNAREREVYEVFKEVLGKNNFSINSNFFQIGGQSIKAMRLLGFLQKKFKIPIKIKDLYQNSSVRELAYFIDNSANQVVDEIVKKNSEQKIFNLSRGQLGIFLHQELNKNSIAYITNGSYIFKENFQIDVFEKAFTILCKRHSILRTTFKFSQGKPVQIIHNEPVLEFLKIESSKEDAIDILKKYYKKTFDLSKLPLFRVVAIYNRKNGESIIGLIFHHIISDGWSDTIIAKEVSDIYNSLIKGGYMDDSNSFQYIDFVEYEKHYLESENAEADKLFWLSRLPSESIEIDIIPDNLRRAVKSNEGKRFNFEFSEDITNYIKLLARESNTTNFNVLLSAIYILIYMFSGEKRITVGIPAANRLKYEFQESIGFFMNLLPVYIELDESLKIVDFIKYITESTLECMKHQTYPFNKIVEESRISFSNNRHPFFDIMMVYHNNDDIEFKIEGARVEEFYTDSFTSRFDLDFEFIDGGKIRGFIEYDSYLYFESTIEKIYTRLCDIIKLIRNNNDSVESVISRIDPCLKIEVENIVNLSENLDEDF
jgi:acyl carrier protein